jgi:hypothetical protein
MRAEISAMEKLNDAAKLAEKACAGGIEQLCNGKIYFAR